MFVCVFVQHWAKKGEGWRINCPGNHPSGRGAIDAGAGDRRLQEGQMRNVTGGHHT